jgi:hypothetical protein
MKSLESSSLLVRMAEGLDIEWISLLSKVCH